MGANISTTGNLGGANLTLTGQLQGPANFIIDPAPVGDDFGLVEIKGNLTVQGLTTTINSTTLTVDDKNIVLGDTASPTDVLADGGGITLKGSTDKTIAWLDSTDAWTVSEHVSIASAKEYRIAGIKVLDATGLGSAVVGSSLTSVGTIASGTWQGGVIAGAYGGTGVANTGKTITLGGDLTTSGNFTLTLTTTAATSVTLPTTGTLIASGAIINADVNASAAIADTKLATITTAGKVSNSATTATSALGINTIVARDGSNNFTAGTITAALTGAASSNVLKAGDTMTGALVMPLGVFGTPSLTFTSDPNTGLFSPGADQVAISTGGTAKFTVGSLDGNPIIENNFPTVRPALDLAFAATKRLDPRVTFVRATSATYVGGDGLVKTAGVNEARFDHNPATGESLGLLVEESRTNLALRSQELATSPFTALSGVVGGFTVTNNVTTSPDETSNASQINSTSYTNGDSVYQDASATGNGTYTLSIFVKGGTCNSISFAAFFLYNSAQGFSFNYNPLTGTITGTGGGSNHTVVPYPNGWYRIYFTVTGTNVLNTVLRFQVYTSATGITYLWGAQLEAGAFPTSYIPTSGSTVTRSADVASMTGTNFSSWYNQSEGSVFIDLIAVPGNRTQNNTNTFGISPVAGPWGGNLIGQNTDSQGTWYAYDAGSLELIQTINLNPNGNKFAWGLTSGSNTSVVKDGTILSGGFLWGTLQRTALSIGTDSGGSIRWQRLTFYPKRLSNTQLQALTT